MIEIHLAHSPDADDAFMFYGLAQGKVDTGPYRFHHHLDGIEALNQAAAQGRYEVTALSIHAYAYVSDRYALLNTGASMGEGYGPLVVARSPMDPASLDGLEVGIPGLQTSAWLALRLLVPGVRPRVFPFDRIMDEVAAGTVPAGLIIHEGQLSYRRHQLHKIVDLGDWWHRQTGLPLPLGGNAIRRDLGRARMAEISSILAASIRYGLEHRDEALQYALAFGRGLSRVDGDRFVGMYVNARTLDYGEEGRRAVQEFLDRGFTAGLIPSKIKVEFF
jgi:1,4-dihydroxy-6-naphthoate synthase